MVKPLVLPALMGDPVPSLCFLPRQHFNLKVQYSVREDRLQMATSLDRWVSAAHAGMLVPLHGLTNTTQSSAPGSPAGPSSMAHTVRLLWSLLLF